MQSKGKPNDTSKWLYYYLDDDLLHQADAELRTYWTIVTARLCALPRGFTVNSGLFLNYVTPPNTFLPGDMSLLPADVEDTEEGEFNDLQDLLGLYTSRAVSVGPEKATVYVFGRSFSSGFGVHDVHMNQLSVGNFAGANADNSDGALMLLLHTQADENRWV